MRRILLTLVAVLAWESQAFVLGTLPSGLAFTEGAINHVQSAAVATNPQLGTILVIFTPTSIANSGRVVGGKSGGTHASALSRLGGDGSILTLIAGRSTTSQSVRTPTGALQVGVPVCVAAQWDIAGGTPTMYLGRLDAQLLDVSATVTAGSGTHTNTNGTYRLGATGANAAGMTAYAQAIALVRLQLDEMQAWCDNPLRPVRQADVQWLPLHGAGHMLDVSGNARHGTTTGAVLTGNPAVLPRYQPFPGRWFQGAIQ